MNRELFRPFLLALAGCLVIHSSVANGYLQTDNGDNVADADKANDDATNEEATDDDAADDAVDEILAGHSYHGDAFNEGPRQKAYLMGGTGNVHFPVTTESKEVQNYINQGVGQLHGFWDLEAERTFRQAAAIDESCAMAYWGAALATVRNRERAQGFIAKAMERIESVSERERMYIKALDKYLKDKPKSKSKRAENYIKDLESISLEFPDDLEAKALIAHRIWQNQREGVPISSYLAADALLQEILREEPLHPSHHYLIHLWDYRCPEKAIESAARCGPSAPSIAHMWHMPGHIYSRLKRYEDAVYQQEASARVDHAHMMRDQVMPDQIHNFAHNNEWLIRNLAFVGRVDDAIALAENMISLPRHPKYNTLEKQSGSTSYGRRRLIDLLSVYQLHDLTIRYCQTDYLSATEIEREQIRRERLLGCALAAEQLDYQAVVQTLERLLSENKSKLAEAEWQFYVTRPLIRKDRSHFKSGQLSDLPSLTHVGGDAAKKLHNGSIKDRSNARSIVDRCESALLAIEGYRAWAAGDFKTAYEKLKEAGDEDKSWLAEIQFLSGEKESALKELNKVMEKRENEVVPLARKVFLLDAAGDDGGAKEAFEQLRETSSSMDLHVPLFARLEPIAQKLGYSSSWLKEKSIPADILFRPELANLGPMRWSPWQAPEWKLLNPRGSMTGSQSFQDRPYILIFFLGHGCLHCAEQLQAFAPQYEKFKSAGLDIVAVSSDGDEGLKRSLDSYNGQMPIPLVSDENLKVFKSFRAFDDFEQLPLHGTFLIDASGQVRWQDISYEPFMDHEFLLKESLRLLYGLQQVDQKITQREP